LIRDLHQDKAQYAAQDPGSGAGDRYWFFMSPAHDAGSLSG